VHTSRAAAFFLLCITLAESIRKNALVWHAVCTATGVEQPMNETIDLAKTSRVEISGWTSDNQFFVEKAEMMENDDGEQRLLLRRDLPNGALIFVRWQITQDASGAAPRAYKIENLRHVAAIESWEVRLQPIIRRRVAPAVSGRPTGVPVKESYGELESNDAIRASNALEDIFP
jgi:hypothetical protein